MLSALRRSKNRGRSGKILAVAGQVVLALGVFTNALDQRFGVGGVSLTLLELVVVAVGVVLVVALVRTVVRKVKRTVGLGVLSALSLGVAVPTLGVALPAVSIGGRLAARLPLSRLPTSRLPWLGKSRWERALDFAGGPKGLAATGAGATVLGAGARLGKLGETHALFGNHVSLFAAVLLLSVPGALIYGIRRP